MDLQTLRAWIGLFLLVACVPTAQSAMVFSFQPTRVSPQLLPLSGSLTISDSTTIPGQAKLASGEVQALELGAGNESVLFQFDLSHLNRPAFASDFRVSFDLESGIVTTFDFFDARLGERNRAWFLQDIGAPTGGAVVSGAGGAIGCLSESVAGCPPASTDNNIYLGTYAGNWVLEPTSVPEPGSLVLLGLGLAGIALARRRGTRGDR